MTEFQPFEMERWMSKYEKAVEYNLSESGVHPMLVSEVLADRPGAVEDLLATDLDYAHANGIPTLREHIAAMYDGCGPDNVLVTTGAIEANYNTVRTLLSPGDGIAVERGVDIGRHHHGHDSVVALACRVIGAGDDHVASRSVGDPWVVDSYGRGRGR